MLLQAFRTNLSCFRLSTYVMQWRRHERRGSYCIIFESTKHYCWSWFVDGTCGERMTTETVPVMLHHLFPTEVTTSSIASRPLRNTTRNLQYTAPTNAHITIVVTPLGGSGTTYGPTPCASDSCAISFTAAPGPNTIAFTLTHGQIRSQILARQPLCSQQCKTPGSASRLRRTDRAISRPQRKIRQNVQVTG